MARMFLGLGSNIGDRRRWLREAVDSLSSVGLGAISPVYETEPVGGPTGQRPFFNLVVELYTDLSARELLGVCHRLEAAAGRVRGERWGPRTLDVDILWMQDTEIGEPDLVIPHPRMWSRRFVLAPMRDIAPDLVSAEALEASEGHVNKVGPLSVEDGG